MDIIYDDNKFLQFYFWHVGRFLKFITRNNRHHYYNDINYNNAYSDTYVNKSTIVFFKLNIFKVILFRNV